MTRLCIKEEYKKKDSANMSLFTVADFDKLNIGDDPKSADDLTKVNKKIVAHARIDKEKASMALKIVHTMLNKFPDLVTLFSGELFEVFETEESDGRRSIVFKKNKKYNENKKQKKTSPLVAEQQKECIPRMTLWVNNEEMPYEQIQQNVDKLRPQGTDPEVVSDEVVQNIRRVGETLYKIMRCIFKTLLEQGKINKGHRLGPLTILICKKIADSDHSCSEQSPHYDYDIEELKKIKDDAKPLSVILNPMDAPAKFVVVEGEDMNKKTEYNFTQNEYIAFLGDLCHAGAAYTEDHVRFHAYILHKNSMPANLNNAVDPLIDHLPAAVDTNKRKGSGAGDYDNMSESDGDINECDYTLK